MRELNLDKKHVKILEGIGKGLKIKAIAKSLGFAYPKTVYRRIRTLDRHEYIGREGRKRGHKMWLTPKGDTAVKLYNLGYKVAKQEMPLVATVKAIEHQAKPYTGRDVAKDLTGLVIDFVADHVEEEKHKKDQEIATLVYKKITKIKEGA